MNNTATRNLVMLAVIIALAFLAYSFLTMPDHRTTTEKVGDAIHDLPQGVNKAGRQLEDRTPGQKIGDAIKDDTKSQ
jgi:hypothetical protein